MIRSIETQEFSALKPLDFIVIGAQKSATTTLYKYLEAHPSIAMPKSKEAPFFCREDISHKALAEFNTEHFGESADNKLRGKVSPQYMSSPIIPNRIFEMMPKTKLIAVLRDPVSRCFSHYRMARRRGTENREFSSIVQHQIFSSEQIELNAGRSRSAPLHENGYVSESDFLIAWSEYGRILESYYQRFPEEQILVLFTQELKNNPSAVIDRVMSFLELDRDYRPEVLGQSFHQGGDSQWISNRQRSAVANLPVIRHCWHAVPESLKQELRYWFEQRNIRKDSDGLRLDRASAEKLRKHFCWDMQTLSNRVSLPNNWIEKYGLKNV